MEQVTKATGEMGWLKEEEPFTMPTRIFTQASFNKIEQTATVPTYMRTASVTRACGKTISKTERAVRS